MANARLYTFWGSLTEALRTGVPQNEDKTGGDVFGALYADADRLNDFAHAMTGLTIGAVMVMAEKCPWQDYKTVFDIGSAEGGLVAQLAERHLHLTGGGTDLPGLEPAFNSYVASFGLQVQEPGVPIYLAAFAPGSMKRIALSADGWTPVAVPIDQMQPMMASIRQVAAEAGRDGDALKLWVRGNIHLTASPLAERYPFVGSWEQVVADIKATRDCGADELFVEPQGETPEEFIRVMERVMEAVHA